MHSHAYAERTSVSESRHILIAGIVRLPLKPIEAGMSQMSTSSSGTLCTNLQQHLKPQTHIILTDRSCTPAVLLSADGLPFPCPPPASQPQHTLAELLPLWQLLMEVAVVGGQ